MWAEDEGIGVPFLLHDRDGKFTDGFDDHFRCADGGPIRTPPGAPIANCFIESWIGSLNPSAEDIYIGFRVSEVPEPGSTAILALGVVGMLRQRRNARG